MKIGIDCRLWNESGVGRYTRNLVYQLQKLDQKNNYVLFIQTKDKEQIIGLITNPQFSIVGADVRWHTFAEQLKFLNILNREKLDLVHFPYFSLPVFYRKRFVVTIHDLIPFHFSTGKASTLSPLIFKFKLLGYKYGLRKASKKAKMIIAVTKSVEQDIVKTLDISRKKIKVIYEGVEELSEIKSEKVEIESPYLLYVGNAYPHKNLKRLIEAFRKVQLDNPTLKLLLVGKEDFFYRRIKDEIGRLKLENHIELFGYATEGQLKYLYQNAKALIVPSLSEGFGLPALEAMANKCLVVASEIPALLEICKDTALYFNPNDVASMIKVIEKAINENHKEKKENGFSRSKDFSFEKMAKQTLAIYQDAAI